MKIGSGKYFCYISFKESLPDVKLYILHISKMNNVETRFESLFNARVVDRVKSKREIGFLRDMILAVKVNKAQLFVGVE